MNNKWRSSLQDVRTYKAADINSDHYLVIAKIKLKLKKVEIAGTKKPCRFNGQKLKFSTVTQECKLELNGPQLQEGEVRAGQK